MPGLLRTRVCAGLISLIVLFTNPEALAAKTDVVELVNGDRITGEVKELSRGILQFKTDNLGTVNIEWDKVSRLNSKLILHVELASGKRFVGSIEPGAEPGDLRVTAEDEVGVIAVADTVHIAPLDTEGSISDRFDGYVDFGFSNTKATEVTELSFDAGFSQRTIERLWEFDMSAILSDSETAEYTNIVMSGMRRKFLANRYYWTGVSQFEHNDAQGLDLRALIGWGFGRYVLQSNTHELALAAGLAATRENLEDDTQTDSIELMLAFSYDAFRFDDPELDLSTSLTVFPSLTESGRVRTQLDVSLRYELIDSLFAELTFRDSYDSQPQSIDAEKNDYSITSSIGYTF